MTGAERRRCVQELIPDCDHDAEERNPIVDLDTREVLARLCEECKILWFGKLLHCGLLKYNPDEQGEA